MVAMKNQPTLQGYQLGNFYFTSEDCRGQAYYFLDLGGRPPLQALFVDAFSPAIYYLYDTEVSPVSGSDIKSNKSTNSNSCESQTFGPDRVAFPVKQIYVPFMNTKLQYPIVVRPIR